MPARIVIVENKPNDYCIIMRELLKMEFDPVIMKQIKKLISENPNASPELLNYIGEPRRVKPFDPEDYEFDYIRSDYSINFALENLISLITQRALKDQSKEEIEQAIRSELGKFEDLKEEIPYADPLLLWLDDTMYYDEAIEILEDLLTRQDMTLSLFEKYRGVFQWALDKELQDIDPALFSWFNPKDFGKGKLKAPLPLYQAFKSPDITASWFLSILSICKSIGRRIDEIEALYLANNKMKRHPLRAASLLARSWRYKKFNRSLKSLKVADQFLTERLNEDIFGHILSHF
jgi:hypothetical protein